MGGFAGHGGCLRLGPEDHRGRIFEMKRLVLLTVLLLLFRLSSASLVWQAENTVPLEVQKAARSSLERSMLPRLGADGELSAMLRRNGQDGYVLNLQYKGRTLEEDLIEPVGTMERRLSENLEYDGLALLDPIGEQSLSFRFSTGYGTKALKEGSQWWVLDGQGNRRGSVVVSKTFKAQQMSLLDQTEGKKLSLGMALVPRLSHPVSLSVDMDVSFALGFSLTVGSLLPVYPFSWFLEAAYRPGSTVSLSVGLQSQLPLASVFSDASHLWRNLAVLARSSVGYGYATSLSQQVLCAQGSVGFSYQVGSFSFLLLGGNRFIANAGTIAEQGLFLSLSSAYTYTP
jgi:hypothetical protein